MVARLVFYEIVTKGHFIIGFNLCYLRGEVLCHLLKILFVSLVYKNLKS